MSSSIDPEGAEISVIHELVDIAGTSVLEVGCGDGRLTWRYADEATTVLAMDINREKIARAEGASPAALRSKVSLVVADVAKVGLASDTFDIAILSHSL